MRDHPQYLVVISSSIRILGLHLHVNSLQVSVEVQIIQCLSIFSYLDLVEDGGRHGHNASLSQAAFTEDLVSSLTFVSKHPVTIAEIGTSLMSDSLSMPER